MKVRHVKLESGASFRNMKTRACFTMAGSWELDAPRDAERKSHDRQHPFLLASREARSKLQAPCYDEAGKRGPTTDHRLLTTDY